jgi:hypothetical protein
MLPGLFSHSIEPDPGGVGKVTYRPSALVMTRRRALTK